MIPFLEKFPGKPIIKQVPEPKKLRHLIGPGVILLATALGSGEIYFWPGITMKYGFVLIWPALMAISLQYILNTEFARYTISTGETVITGFIRLWKPLGIVFLIGATLPWIWPGWSMGGATALSWLIGFDPMPIAVGSLLLIGVILSVSKSSYQNLEIAEKILISFIIIVLIIISILLVQKDSLAELSKQVISFSVSFPKELDIPTLLAALAFCGAGGTLNLATSNWVQEKRMGMSSHLSGNGEQSYYFENNRGNVSRWKAWWRLVRKEQLISFLLVGTAGLIMLMLLSHSLVFGQNYPIGMEFLKAEGEAISQSLTVWMRPVFYLVVALVFFSTAMGVIDHMARISANIIQTYYPKLSIKGIAITPSMLYYSVLWLVILFGVLVLTVFNIDQPPILLAIAGSLSGFFMFVYSGCLLIMSMAVANQFKKSEQESSFNPFKIGIIRKILITISILFYGWFSVVLVIGLFK